MNDIQVAFHLQKLKYYDYDNVYFDNDRASDEKIKERLRL